MDCLFGADYFPAYKDAMKERKQSEWSSPDVEGILLKRDKPFGLSLIGATLEFPDFHFSASDSASEHLWATHLCVRATAPVSSFGKADSTPNVGTAGGPGGGATKPIDMSPTKPLENEISELNYASYGTPVIFSPSDTPLLALWRKTSSTLQNSPALATLVSNISTASSPMTTSADTTQTTSTPTTSLDTPTTTPKQMRDAERTPEQEEADTKRRQMDDISRMAERERLLALKEKLISKEDANELYTVTKHSLGKGVGEVMYGISKKTGEKVAVKKLLPIRRGRDRTYTIMRFIVNTHPHRQVVMEYVQGGSLYDYIRVADEKGAYFSEAHVSYISREYLQALQFLHSQNRIHRDIKVDNILASITGDIKLADFGTAVQLSHERLQRTTLCGTSYYMAPELTNRTPYDSSVDIWSVGITVIELLDGEPPFYDMSPNDAIKAIGNFGNVHRICLSEKHSLTARDFANNCCLQYDPEQRATATQLLEHPFLELACEKEEFREFLIYLGDVMALKNQLNEDSSCMIL